MDTQVGICGEHGGEPSSVAFFDGVGLDYVSCSPFRFVCVCVCVLVRVCLSPHTYPSNTKVRMHK